MPIKSTDMPIVFADGVANFTHSTETAKFYVYRFDPGSKDITGRDEAEIVGSAQIIMPLTGFFEGVAFLLRAIEKVLAEIGHSREQSRPATYRGWFR